MQLSLYKKLKPEFKESLLKNIEEYPSITTDVIKALSSNTHWSTLSMGDVSSLITFTHHTFEEMTSTDWITGEIFFNEQED
jgi:hypothetical protein|tara:strand:- start:909 stop:1151 length:243 start_codon:yes stop_codon:yes gene_type:complete